MKVKVERTTRTVEPTTTITSDYFTSFRDHFTLTSVTRCAKSYYYREARKSIIHFH